MGRLQGKVAIITGASKGIGADIAKGFAAEGARVVVNYRGSRDGAERAVAAIEASGGEAIAIQANVAVPVEAAALVAAAVDHFGALDILVNNAGVFQYMALADITEEQFRYHFDTNVLGLLMVTQAAAPHLPDRSGCILNIGSAATHILAPTTTLYTASKASVDAITRMLAKELGPRGIRVNALAPGGVYTEGVEAKGLLGGEWEDFLVQSTPLGRMGETSDIVPSAIFLASSEAAWVTGEILTASGGL